MNVTDGLTAEKKEVPAGASYQPPDKVQMDGIVFELRKADGETVFREEHYDGLYCSYVWKTDGGLHDQHVYCSWEISDPDNVAPDAAVMRQLRHAWETFAAIASAWPKGTE